MCHITATKRRKSREISDKKRRNSKENSGTKRRKSNLSQMAMKVNEVIEIDDSTPSPEPRSTPLRTIFCLKNRDEIEKYEEDEECFILEFDPYIDIDLLKLGSSKDDEVDIHVVAEKGQVACRDYPHPRHTCAEYPFEKTSHDQHCKMCYCYVCDLTAPCSKWTGSTGHCHAFNNAAWTMQKETSRLQKETANVIRISGISVLS